MLPFCLFWLPLLLLPPLYAPLVLLLSVVLGTEPGASEGVDMLITAK